MARGGKFAAGPGGGHGKKGGAKEKTPKGATKMGSKKGKVARGGVSRRIGARGK